MRESESLRVSRSEEKKEEREDFVERKKERRVVRNVKR